MLGVPRIIIGVVALALLALPGGAQELSPDILRLAHAMTTNRDLLKRFRSIRAWRRLSGRDGASMGGRAIKMLFRWM
jgi:hypothetical protein